MSVWAIFICGRTSERKRSQLSKALRRWLPKYTPELNDIEVVWHDLKAYNPAHQTFTGVAELDGAIHKAVEDLNRERAVVPLAKPRISA
jgi:transposase